MLTQDVDFKCADRLGRPLPICYGVGVANHRLFQTLQQLMNRFSIPGPDTPGFRPLLVDGFIGSATVAAIDHAAGLAFMWGGGNPAFHNFMGKWLAKEDRSVPSGVTKELISARAPELVEAFRAAVSAAIENGVKLAPLVGPVTSPAVVGQLAPTSIATVRDATQIYFAQEEAWSRIATPSSAPAPTRDFWRHVWRPAFDHWFRHHAARRPPDEKLGPKEIYDLAVLFRDTLYPKALAAGLSRDSFVFDPADGREIVGQDARAARDRAEQDRLNRAIDEARARADAPRRSKLRPEHLEPERIPPPRPRPITDRVLINATNETFWQLTRHKPGQQLDMADPRDRAMSKTWLDLYAQIRGRRDRATSLAKHILNETVTPYVLVIEQRDGSLTHRTFERRNNLDVQYDWLLDQPEYYTYAAMFDFTQSHDAPIRDQFRIVKRQQMATSGWYGW